MGVVKGAGMGRGGAKLLYKCIQEKMQQSRPPDLRSTMQRWRIPETIETETAGNRVLGKGTKKRNYPHRNPYPITLTLTLTLNPNPQPYPNPNLKPLKLTVPVKNKV